MLPYDYMKQSVKHIKKLRPYPSPAMKELFNAALLLRTPREASDFFRDLLTIAELTEFASRWQIVKRLNKGESYLKIATELNVSTTTVTRVAQWLHEGMGGYRTIATRAFGKNPDYQPEKPLIPRGKRWVR